MNRRSFLKTAIIATGAVVVNPIKFFGAMPTKEELKGERFYRVVFGPQQSMYDTEDVVISLNGNTLIIERNVKVIIPSAYKEIADHCVTHDNSKFYSYTLLGEATKKEYLAQLSAGIV